MPHGVRGQDRALQRKRISARDIETEMWGQRQKVSRAYGCGSYKSAFCRTVASASVPDPRVLPNLWVTQDRAGIPGKDGRLHAGGTPISLETLAFVS